MRWIAGIVVAATAVVAVGAGAGGADARQCQAGFTESRAPAQLAVTGDTCANGRKVALRVAQTAPAGCIIASSSSRRLRFRKPCTQSGYRCGATTVKTGYSLHVTCTRGARRIRFTY